MKGKKIKIINPIVRPVDNIKKGDVILQFNEKQINKVDFDNLSSCERAELIKSSDSITETRLLNKEEVKKYYE